MAGAADFFLRGCVLSHAHEDGVGVLMGDGHLRNGHGQRDSGVNVWPAKLANSARPNTIFQPVGVLKVAGYWLLKLSY